jgi:hypothetical protein
MELPGSCAIGNGIYFGSPIRLPYAGEAGERNNFRGDGYFSPGQTIIPDSFQVAILLARENEAAGAADAAACIDPSVGTVLLKNGWGRR